MTQPPTQLAWTPELVNRFWDAVAHSPLKDLSFARTSGAKLLDLIAPHLPPSATVIDVGAGDGDFSELLLGRGYQVAALEPSPERQQALRARLEGSTNFLGVVSTLDPEKYDVAVVVEVIEHVLEPDFKSFLQSVATTVRPGGWLVVTTPNSENLDYARVFCPVSNTFFHPWQHQRSFTPNQLELLLLAYGFQRDFLVLADFSNDAAVYESFRVMSKPDSANPQDLARLLVLHQHEINLHMIALLKEMRNTDAGTAARQTRVLATLQEQVMLQQKIMAVILQSSSLHMKDALHLAAISAEVQDSVRYGLAEYRKVLSERDWQDAARLAETVTGSPVSCDLQTGRGTNIVYIARKA